MLMVKKMEEKKNKKGGGCWVELESGLALSLGTSASSLRVR